MEFIKGGICAPEGFKANGVHCGIRKNKTKNDLGLIFSDVCCNAAGVYTQNKVVGAPVVVTKKNMVGGKARAIICNSGNANTCNADGEVKAKEMCDLVASAMGIKREEVIVASTGVIGQSLPIEPIQSAISSLTEGLNKEGSHDMALAIMTTDTFKKEYAVTFKIADKVCKIGAIAKGSGMIHPNMATMLCFVTTDLAISSNMLQIALKTVVDDTINMVSVDGDTSTNDMMMILASGLAGNDEITTQEEDGYEIFIQALNAILKNIAKDLARDGEGATKLLECIVTGAEEVKVAKIVAKSVITSSLFKAAMFASDANWGRILCAIGYADAEFNINTVDVALSSGFGRVEVCKNGTGITFSEEYAKQVLLQDYIKIEVNLGGGDKSAKAWGCDLTYDYVKINADYRT